MFESIPSKVNIVEVGPRDGLQNEKEIVTLDNKLKFIQLLSKSGLKTIEATSFVSPKAIPQMADAKNLYSQLSHIKLSLPVLVPNLKGYEIAKSVGVKEIALFSATSDEFTKKNINSTIEESFLKMKEVAKLAAADGVKVRGYISTAFGCPYAGKMSKEKLLEVLLRFLDLGVYQVSIGDTIGVATPTQVDEYLSFLKTKVDVEKLAMHFHDTRGMAISNVLVSLNHGIKTFDSSAGGLGGCPYAKGATGNVATEDLLYLFHSMGIETGVDLDLVKEASIFILDAIGKETPSKFLNAYIKSGY